jgi:hypothetical protein
VRAGKSRLSRRVAHRLKPIFDALGGSVQYEQIRVVLQCLRNRAAANSNTNSRRPTAAETGDY